MGTVNCGSSLVTTKKELTKKELEESVDQHIVQKENERVHTECFKGSCFDMADDIHQSNKAKGTPISERFFARLEQMTNDSSATDISIASRLSTLQDLHFGFVPLETP
jgi:hypothetical protein